MALRINGEFKPQNSPLLMRTQIPFLALSCAVLVGCAPAWVLPVRTDGTFRQSIDVSPPTNSGHALPKNYFPHRSDLTWGRLDTRPAVRTRYMPHIPLNLGPLDSKLEISVVVEPDGVVRESVVTVSSGNREIDELYLAAVRSWSYTPALIGGKPVAVQAHQDFKIRLY